MRNYQSKNVDEYIANAPVESRAKLAEFRKIIKSVLPNVEETIAWGVPFYKHHGYLAGFSVFKNHVTFGLTDIMTDEASKKLEESGYKVGKKTFQVRFDQKIPVEIIKKLIKAKADNLEKMNGKTGEYC